MLGVIDGSFIICSKGGCVCIRLFAFIVQPANSKNAL
jgi:hypothetical protein